MSSADRVKFSYAVEATPGTTPNNATMRALRITSDSLKITYQNDQSKELSDDRVEREQIIIGATVGGDLNHEMLFDAHQDFIAAVMGRTVWTVDGVNPKKSTIDNGNALPAFSILKQFSDLSNVNHLFKGNRVNTWNVTIPKKGIITGVFGVMGQGFANGAIGSVLTGAPTFPVASNTDPMNSSSHISAILMDDIPFTSCVDTMGFQFTNNLRPQDCLGSLIPTDYTQGRLQCTISQDIYFKDETLFNKFKNSTAFGLNLNLTDNDGNQLQFDFSRVKYEDMEIVAGGTNQDVIARCRARAFWDPVDGRMVRITAITP